MQKKKRIVFLVGPTASGKSEVSIYLARRLNAEIISCDSMQVYKGMDIITSKPASSLRKKVPHHLIDAVSPSVSYDVSRYRRQALKAMRDIHGKGKIPLFVGGTGLYMSVLIDGIFERQARDERLRQALMNEARERGSQALHAQLTACDPEAAGKIHPNDAKRIIRALEVYRLTGMPISRLQKERKGLGPGYEVRIFCLVMEREALNARIDARVERMFRSGLVAEVKRLCRKRLSKTASQAIGLHEVQAYVGADTPLAEAKERIKRGTRLYAKRQLTWFRKDKRIRWITVGAGENPRSVTEKIWKELS